MSKTYTPEEFHGASDWFYIFKCLFYYYGTILCFVYLGGKIEQRILAPVITHKKGYSWPWCEVNPNAKNVSRFWKNVTCTKCLGRRK